MLFKDRLPNIGQERLPAVKDSALATCRTESFNCSLMAYPDVFNLENCGGCFMTPNHLSPHVWKNMRITIHTLASTGAGMQSAMAAFPHSAPHCLQGKASSFPCASNCVLQHTVSIGIQTCPKAMSLCLVLCI